VSLVCLLSKERVSASPTWRPSNDLNDIKSLDDKPQMFTIKCGMDSSVMIDKKALMKSPALVILDTANRMEIANREFSINIKECYQETLDLVILNHHS
jgi:hypothetical protein